MSLVTERTLLDDIKTNVGEVQINPTQYTVLERLKNIETNTSGGSVTFLGYGVVTLDANPKLIVSANTLRKNVIIQSGASNGVLYLGYDVNVTNINYVVMLNKGDSYSNDSYLGDYYVADSIATDTISFGEV